MLCHSFIYQQRCQKTCPVGLLQCLTTKHLSPNALCGYSGQGRRECLGEKKTHSFQTFWLVAGRQGDLWRVCGVPPAGPCFGHFSSVSHSVLASAPSLMCCHVPKCHNLHCRMWSIFMQALWWLSQAEFGIQSPKDERCSMLGRQARLFQLH